MAADPVWAPRFTFDAKQLAWMLMAYGFVAAVLPVWLLLAPRDYLSTFLKIGTVVLLAACDSKPTAEPRSVTARGDLADSERSTIELFETAGPSVVFINTSGRVVDLYTRNVFDVPQGSGSGFVWDDQGHVVTNFHVIANASRARVVLGDQREFDATLVGASPEHDLAVLKIEANGLPTVKLGDVNRLKVGEWVVAIGSPFGFDSTVTAGIVSAKARDTGDFLPLIQTDVAINPGNSGGPLLNLRGEVVGINSQIYSRSGGFMGISFAIPIDEAMRVAGELRASGKVVRGRIGVVPGPVTKEVAEGIKLPRAYGALVQRVEPDSPADKAGVEGGDVITKVDGKTIEKFNDIFRIVGGIRPGTKSSLQVFRNGSFRELPVTVAELKEASGARDGEAPDGKAERVSPFGLSFNDLTEAQRKELRVKGGVVIEEAEGAAARAGLRAGDVILSVDGTAISGAKQAQALLAKLEKAKSVTMLVRRGDSTNFVLVKPQR